MQINPDSHLFEEQDFALLRMLAVCASTAAELEFASDNRPALLAILQRIRFLLKMDMIVIDSIDLDEHKPVYAITDIGRRFIDVIDRTKRQGAALSTQSLDGLHEQSKRAVHPRSSKWIACMWCGSHCEGAAWCSEDCFKKDSARWDTVWLWELGIRVDDGDLIGVVGPIRHVHECK